MLSVLLHYYGHATDHENESAVLELYEVSGMLCENTNKSFNRKYQLSSFSKAYIELLLCTPPPKKAWVNESGEVIGIAND